MSLPRQHRWMLRHLGAGTLLIAGILVLPAYLLQQNLVVRALQVVLFAVTAVLAGKRLQWTYFLSVSAAIVLFHLFAPNGRVLAELGPLQITAGALRTGAFKALTIVGLVFISLSAVRADLVLPGRLGALAGRLLWCFEQIMERRGAVTLRDAARSVDELLLSLYDDLRTLSDAADSVRRRRGIAAGSDRAGFAVVASIVGAQWLSLLL